MTDPNNNNKGWATIMGRAGIMSGSDTYKRIVGVVPTTVTDFLEWQQDKASWPTYFANYVVDVNEQIKICKALAAYRSEVADMQNVPGPEVAATSEGALLPFQRTNAQFRDDVRRVTEPSDREIEKDLPTLDPLIQAKINSFCENYEVFQRNEDKLTHDDIISHTYKLLNELNTAFALHLEINKNGKSKKTDIRKGDTHIPDVVVEDHPRFDGEIKLTWKLKDGIEPDYLRLPTGPCRKSDGSRSSRTCSGGSTSTPQGALGQICNSAHEYFVKYPNDGEYRSFFTDSDSWFLVKIYNPRVHTQSDKLVYISRQYSFRLSVLATEHTVPQDPSIVTLLFRHLLWVRRMQAQALPAKFYKRGYANPTLEEKKEVIDSSGVINNFSLLSVLGRGASCTVYHARSSTSQEVALKLVPANSSTQLLNEIYILAALVGLPGVPLSISYGQTVDGQEFYLATNIVGMPVTALTWSEVDATTLWNAVVAIIKGIHERGIAVIDLKPDHLVLAPTGLFIIDYGCSYFVDRGRPLILMFVSPIFSSVEEYTNFANPGFVSDWESLVFIFIFLMRRKLPWTPNINTTRVLALKRELLTHFPELPPHNLPIMPSRY